MRHSNSPTCWGPMTLVKTTRRKSILSPRQVKRLITGNQMETVIGFFQNWLIECTGAYSQNRKVEFTRVTSQYHIFEFVRTFSSPWILAVGFLSAMIFLNCVNRFFSFKEHRTDMFKLTGTHRLVIFKYHQPATQWQ